MLRSILLKNLFLILLLTFCTSKVLAEGTAQLWPSGVTSEKVGIQIWDNADPDRQFATYNSLANYRLNIHIADLSEVVHYGFAIDPSAFNGNVYYRIKDPNGNVVVGPTLVPTSGAGFINNHTEAINGPKILSTTGYTSLSFSPAMLGDYYIEFNPSSATVLTRNNVRFTYFDITVVNGIQEKLGRLWSRNWDCSNFAFSNNVQSSFFVYSTDGVVSELVMNGIRPFGFEVACNNTGPVNTGNPSTDRQSKSGKLGYALYKIFLSDPDNLSYPTGTFSNFGSNPAYLSGCSGNYCVNVDYTGSGYAQVLLDFNNNGIEDANDVLLDANVTGGYHCFPWDGRDAAGNVINHGFSLNIEATILAGLTHYPIFDAENHPNGFIINVIRPNVPAPVLFYDDTPIGGTADLNGCVAPCHTWTGNFGNNNTVNTWWFGASITNNITLLNNQCDPVANDDIVTGDYGSSLNIDAIVNDTDSDGDDIFIVGAGTNTGATNGSTFANGTITVNNNGTAADPTDDTFDYIPNNGFFGLDSTYYTINDIMGGRDTAVIYIYVEFDLDQDGVTLTGDLDSDNDGVLDTDEDGGTGIDPSADADGDGIPNFIDFSDNSPGMPAFLDTNNDGVNDVFDSDLDGAPDFMDFDSDNDGIPDAIEANDGNPPTNYSDSFGYIIGPDTDNDGLLDAVDNDPATPFGPASTSSLPNNDTDGDGVNDLLDPDSDNDGIFDVVEAGGADTNNDGVIDGFTDINGDGYFDGANLNFLTLSDTDSDGLFNQLDLDSDGDGIDDSREAFSTANDPSPITYNDSDGDGVLDQFDVSNGNLTAVPVDTDNDGSPDYLDLDSDGDGSPDIIESNDSDLNGVADTSPSGNDTDGDGLDDTFDTTPNTWGGESNVPEQNQDNDSEPDWRDVFDLNNPQIFYYVCDATNELYTINPNTGTSTLVGGTAVNNIEAIAYWDGVLYAVDNGNFGTLNLATGAFSLIAEVDGGSTANGSAGAQPLNDVDGLSFDPFTSTLWASTRRVGSADLLFQIDINTGQFVPNAFGTGLDYLVVDGTGVYNDVDDIAVSPLDGDLYTIGNDGTSDQILKINKTTGAIVVVAPASENNVEGLAYYNDGTYYGTVGNSPGEFWTIDPVSGNMSNQIVLPCGDPEAVSALVAPASKINGTVWDDTNSDGVLDGSETGIVNVNVELYLDVNSNGMIDASDELLQTVTTDANGDYTFTFGTTAQLLMQLDLSTLPTGYALTTDNIETTVFSDNVNFGEVDNNNNFGAFSGSDCDGDGIPDFAEGGAGIDTDGDGVDNICDLDSDNDGITDNLETTIDSDADGIPDYLDLDSDNDGIPDAIEANGPNATANFNSSTARLTGSDTDGDGLLDVVDNLPNTAYGASATTIVIVDSDADGVLNYIDLDSDNDGISDLFEADSDFTTLLSLDTDGDGSIDNISDGNNDGYHDPLNSSPFDLPNTDGTTGPNYLDMDSDGDGIDDTREGLTTANYAQPTLLVDNNGNGIIDFWDGNLGGAPIVPIDTDSDGVPDFMDDDSDNDSVLDIIEGNDANQDGIADSNPGGVDADGDGIDDVFDQACPGNNPGYSSLDYAEERNSNGTVNLGSSDLEFPNDAGNLQTVGLLFNNVTIPQGTTINSAFIQFTADEVQTGAVTITIIGEDVDNALTYTSANFNVTSRVTTTAIESWSPAAWNNIGEDGANQRTVDISSIVQEIVNRGGWSSGNNMNFIFSGTGVNRRTAEIFAQLKVDYTGSSNSWGCATNTPHQDTDADGEDDFRDTDDDNDNILTINENADLDGNSTPDYLEASVCPNGFTEQTSTIHASSVFLQVGVTNPNSARFAPDNNVAELRQNDLIVMDMGQVIAAGEVVTIRLTKTSGSGNAEADIEQSSNGATFTNQVQYSSNTASPNFNDFNYVITGGGARYIRVTRTRRSIGLDALTYTNVSCEADLDMDGVPDSIDEDDDNDGISDIVEGNLDTDGDGAIDAMDLDSDNDGIPDAIEANAGVLPTGMNNQGQYTPAYASDVNNDFNGNGWIESSETGESYANNTVTQLDSDGDGIVDRYDFDSDNDGILDAVEANGGSYVTNMTGNGQYPAGYASTNDSDGDGLVDDVDADAGGSPLLNPDTDNDGVPNYLDTDSDNDLISDNLEGFDPDVILSGGDSDFDGLDNAFDPDIGGTLANLPDEDCNLIADYLDPIRNTVSSGPFTISSTWDNGGVPAAGKSIVVRAGHTLTLTGNVSVASVFVQLGATLDLAGFDLTVTGDFQIDGDFLASSGRVLLNGTCTQRVCGDIVFYDISVNNPAGVNLECGDIVFENEVELTGGVLSACAANTVTFASNMSGTAYVASGGAGTIICDVTMERYKEGCADGWMSLGTPFDFNTLNDWDDDVVTTGFPLSDFPNFSFTSIWTYDETEPGNVDNGWTEPNSINDAIRRGVGHYVYEGTANYPLTIATSGTPDLSNFTFPVNYTNTGTPLNDGWNLLANPYPSAIEWDLSATSKWTNVGCCDAVYIWNECVEQYASYISSVGTNGGNSIIPSSSAFWIKAHFSGASLTCTREAMSSQDGDFRQLPDIDKVATIHIDGFSQEDEVKFRLLTGASHGHDDLGDALKKISDETNMGIYITDVMGMKNSIDAFPYDGNSKTIPVWVRVPTTGSYTIDFSGVSDLPANMCFTFHDLQTGTSFDLKTATFYYCNIDAIPTFVNRFIIDVEYPLNTEVNQLTCADSHDGSIVYQASGVGPYDVIWQDVNGNIVRQVTTNGNDTLQGLNPGIFTLTVIDNGAVYCNNLSVELEIEQPTNPLTLSGLASAEGCDGTPGSINLSVGGGNMPFQYNWSNGATTQDIDNVMTGSYSVEVTDADGCEVTETFTVAPAPIVTADFSISDTEINISNGETVNPFNSSTGSTYVWYWGDGNVSTDAQPVYQYSTAGDYTITLVAQDAGCTDTATAVVTVVGEAIGIEENLDNGITAVVLDGMIKLNLNNGHWMNPEITLYNTQGKLIYLNQFNSVSESVFIPLEELADGAYMILIEENGKSESVKLVITQ